MTDTDHAKTDETITIDQAQSKDLAAIMEIARSATLKQGDTPASFLVSNFTEEQYRSFLNNRKQVTFLVARNPAGEPIGFLIGYDQKYACGLPDHTSEAVIETAIGDTAPYSVIKQVAVAPGHHGRGIARALYGAFFDQDQSGLVFAAIVERPVANTGSIKFHKALGFRKILQSSPRNAHYGDRLVNSIWMLPTRPRVIIPASDKEDEAAALSASLSHANELYRHEDQLNWTKVSTLLTVLFALLTASWLLLNAEINTLTWLASATLIVLGYTTLIAIRSKVHSGVAFLKAYKASLRLHEAMYAQRTNSFLPSLWRVPKASRTYDWLLRLPAIALVLWSLASVALLLHLTISLPQLIAALQT